MISASVLTTLAAPVKSQEIFYELVDTGMLADPKRGQGIEMRVTANIVPTDGFYGEINQLAMPNICKHYAPSVIPFIIDKFEMIEPEFIAVRLLSSSSSFGRYILEFYAIENGTCGGKL